MKLPKIFTCIAGMLLSACTSSGSSVNVSKSLCPPITANPGEAVFERTNKDEVRDLVTISVESTPPGWLADYQEPGKEVQQFKLTSCGVSITEKLPDVVSVAMAYGSVDMEPQAQHVENANGEIQFEGPPPPVWQIKECIETTFHLGDEIFKATECERTAKDHPYSYKMTSTPHPSYLEKNQPLRGMYKFIQSFNGDPILTLELVSWRPAAE